MASPPSKAKKISNKSFWHKRIFDGRFNVIKFCKPFLQFKKQRLQLFCEILLFEQFYI